MTNLYGLDTANRLRLASPAIGMDAGYMLRKYLRAARVILVSIILSLVGIEVLLQLTDPLGVSYLYNVIDAKASFIPDYSGYAMPPGTMHLRGWSYTIDADGGRHTPGRVEGGPQIVYLGDSVTFGQSVNDADVWVSVVAERLGLDARNYGRMGFGAFNIARLLETLPAGCAVVLTIPNDVDRTEILTDFRSAPAGSYLVNTFTMLTYGGHKMVTSLGENDTTYHDAMTAIAERPDTLLLTFDDEYGRMAADKYGAQIIPWYTGRVSFTDAHASAAGNAEIADAAAPVIADWLRGRGC
jgi:hypothetical protein